MAPDRGKLFVFISSGMAEFRDLRASVDRALAAMGMYAFVYERSEGSSPESIVRTSLAAVESADIFVALFGEKLGEVTETEYRHARGQKLPILAYLRRDCSRDGTLEAFLANHVRDVQAGVAYRLFVTGDDLGSAIAHDIVAWLVRRHREMTAEIRQAQVSRFEIDRLKGEVQRLQAYSRDTLPHGTAMDYLAVQLESWFTAIGYTFETYEDRKDSYIDRIINVPKRRGYDRILVRAIEGETNLADIAGTRTAAAGANVEEAWLISPMRKSGAVMQAFSQPKPDVFCYTFDELLDDAVDFTPYLTWLDTEIKTRGIDEYSSISLALNQTSIR